MMVERDSFNIASKHFTTWMWKNVVIGIKTKHAFIEIKLYFLKLRELPEVDASMSQCGMVRGCENVFYHIGEH